MLLGKIASLSQSLQAWEVAIDIQGLFIRIQLIDLSRGIKWHEGTDGVISCRALRLCGICLVRLLLDLGTRFAFSMLGCSTVAYGVSASKDVILSGISKLMSKTLILFIIQSYPAQCKQTRSCQSSRLLYVVMRKPNRPFCSTARRDRWAHHLRRLQVLQHHRRVCW